MAFYVTTRVPNSASRTLLQRQAFAPRTMWLIGRPEVGRSMALIDAEGRSLITSRIQRILRGAANDEVYVQTHNSCYHLERSVWADDSVSGASL